jgi:hypothetical protein
LNFRLLHAGHLHDRALGREVALEADDAAPVGDRVAESAGHHVLVGRKVTSARFSAMVLPVTVMQSPCR